MLVLLLGSDLIYSIHTVQADDLSWHSIEKALAHIDPRLSFWQHTASTGLLDRHKPVSMNVIDVALNLCNKMPYEQRIVHYFQHKFVA